MQTTLITGSAGMLGKDIVNTFSKCYRVIGIDKNDFTSDIITQTTLDLTDFVTLKKYLKKNNPEIIVLCAANVNVDNCETNRSNTYKLHVESTNFISKICNHAKIIYISSDSVFNGKKGNYTENDKPQPLNYYAQTKLEGENVLLKNNSNSIIIRTNIFGFNYTRKGSLVEWALENLQANHKIKGFYDVWFNPLYTLHLAQIMLKIVNSDFKGLINVASPVFINKLDFLLELAKVFGFKHDLIEKASVREIRFKSERPLNTTLNVDKYIELFHKNPPNIVQGLLDLKSDYNKICLYEY